MFLISSLQKRLTGVYGFAGDFEFFDQRGHFFQVGKHFGKHFGILIYERGSIRNQIVFIGQIGSSFGKHCFVFNNCLLLLIVRFKNLTKILVFKKS